MNNRFDNYISLINQKLCEVFNICDEDYKVISDAVNYSISAGGKRIRPLIMCEIYRICGGTDNKCINFACALEMIHTYSLIHDDLPCMDNDDFRRGKPSCHKQFGEANALLAGDTLLTHAFSVAASTKGINAERCLKAINYLSIAAGYNGMIGGQVIDLESENKEISAQTLQKLCLLKTGALLRCAAAIGAILAGADEETVGYAEQYGDNLGLAFQITDDILDCTADEKLLGKPTHSDDKNDKSTFVSKFGIEQCRNLAENYTLEAVKALENIGTDVADIKELTLSLLNRNY